MRAEPDKDRQPIGEKAAQACPVSENGGNGLSEGRGTFTDLCDIHRSLSLTTSVFGTNAADC